MKVTEYTSQLVGIQSVSANSNEAIADYVEEFLHSHDFKTERISYCRDGVHKHNVIARLGQGDGGLAYFGHTDVVSDKNWTIADHGPFQPTIRDGRLYGRGSTDMKGSIACMFAAIDSLDTHHCSHPLYVSLTADEELGHEGIVEVINRSELFAELVSGQPLGIVGEPTNLNVVNAHKGGVQIAVTSHGVAAHSSSRDGLNANLAMIPFLQNMKELYEETESQANWQDDRFDPPTICMNLGINDHNPAVNIKSARSECTICFRAMPQTDTETLIDRIRSAARSHGLEFELRSQNRPFFRDPKLAKIRESVSLTHSDCAITVGFGSEACNLHQVNSLVLLGPGSIEQAHKGDEFISLQDLKAGEMTYRKMIKRWCR